jgi:endonuclease/exonuclease/phosphatase family metal-dependent hydrolase
MFQHRKFHKYTGTAAGGKTHSQIDHILIDRRLHSSLFDIRPFGAANCNSNHYLVVAKVRKSLTVNKKQHRSLMWKDLISGS